MANPQPPSFTELAQQFENASNLFRQLAHIPEGQVGTQILAALNDIKCTLGDLQIEVKAKANHEDFVAFRKQSEASQHNTICVIRNGSLHGSSSQGFWKLKHHLTNELIPGFPNNPMDVRNTSDPELLALFDAIGVPMPAITNRGWMQEFFLRAIGYKYS